MTFSPNLTFSCPLQPVLEPFIWPKHAFYILLFLGPLIHVLKIHVLMDPLLSSRTQLKQKL